MNAPASSEPGRLAEMGKKQTEADEGHPLYPKGSPSKAGITVLRRASTRPNGEPKRKKPETLKSRRAALVGPSEASELAAGGQEAVLARRGSPVEEAVEATWRLWRKEKLSIASQVQPMLRAKVIRQECHLF